MHESCFDGAPQVGLASHVIDCVVDEHGVEEPTESQRAHVTLVVLAVGAEPAGDLQHLGRQVDQGHGEAVLEVHGVMPATASQPQDVAYGNRSRVKHPGQEVCLLCVILRR